MAKPEQTEKPTGKRISEARSRGQVAKSADIAAAAIFLVAVFVLHGALMPTIAGLGGSLHAALDNLHQEHGLNFHSVWGMFILSARTVVPMLALLFLAFVAIALGANMAQFGFLFAPQKIKPSFGTLNPISGFKTKFFSTQILVNLGKQLLKLGAVFIIVYPALSGNMPAFYTVSQTSPQNIIVFINDLLFGIGWRFGFLLLVVGLFDYAYERWHLMDSLKMSKQEVKDEWKQAEGSPEAKQATKKRARETARKRMMAAVPKATVVITNPTHYAIALAWDEIKMEAPVLTAKGADLLAKRIRDLAREHNVPIVENPPLARTLYERVDLDSAVPANLYAAVAQIIAFVYKLKNRTIA